MRSLHLGKLRIHGGKGFHRNETVHIRVLGTGGNGLHGLDEPGGCHAVSLHGLSHSGHGLFHGLRVLHHHSGGCLDGGLGRFGVGHAKDGGNGLEERHGAFSGKRLLAGRFSGSEGL